MWSQVGGLGPPALPGRPSQKPGADLRCLPRVSDLFGCTLPGGWFMSCHPGGAPQGQDSCVDEQLVVVGPLGGLCVGGGVPVAEVFRCVSALGGRPKRSPSTVFPGWEPCFSSVPQMASEREVEVEGPGPRVPTVSGRGRVCPRLVVTVARPCGNSELTTS